MPSRTEHGYVLICIEDVCYIGWIFIYQKKTAWQKYWPFPQTKNKFILKIDGINGSIKLWSPGLFKAISSNMGKSFHHYDHFYCMHSPNLFPMIPNLLEQSKVSIPLIYQHPPSQQYHYCYHLLTLYVIHLTVWDIWGIIIAFMKCIPLNLYYFLVTFSLSHFLNSMNLGVILFLSVSLCLPLSFPCDVGNFMEKHLPS